MNIVFNENINNQPQRRRNRDRNMMWINSTFNKTITIKVGKRIFLKQASWTKYSRKIQQRSATAVWIMFKTLFKNMTK